MYVDLAAQARVREVPPRCGGADHAAIYLTLSSASGRSTLL
jgi:hypothetical protein